MAKRDLPLVAVVGRPNVGKSTLFNRLVGSRKALVEDSPGVTRDRHYAAFDWVGHRFRIVDTGGYDTSNETLVAAIRCQTEYAIAEADAIIFIVDSSEGLLPSDVDAWEFLRRARVPVFVAANKVDEGVHESRLLDLARLGIEPIFPISALHGRGVADLLDALIKEKCNHRDTETQRAEGEEKGRDNIRAALGAAASPGAEERVPRIAVIGKPNVGKSTLVNRLLGEERHITSDMAGTTRDAIDSTVEIGGRVYSFIDTAGIRQKARIKARVEHFSVALALKAIERADVSLLIVDASESPSDQDAKLAGIVRDKGRGLIVVLNKWDLAVERKITKRAATAEMMRCLHFLPDTPTVFVTATTGSGVDRVLPLVDRVFVNFARRVATSHLNRTLERLVVEKPPPTVRGRLMKILYITQARTAPPTFVIATNIHDKVPENYRRYIENRLREALSLQGCPVRLHFRTRER